MHHQQHSTYLTPQTQTTASSYEGSQDQQQQQYYNSFQYQQQQHQQSSERQCPSTASTTSSTSSDSMIGTSIHSDNDQDNYESSTSTSTTSNINSTPLVSAHQQSYFNPNSNNNNISQAVFQHLQHKSLALPTIASLLHQHPQHQQSHSSLSPSSFDDSNYYSRNASLVLSESPLVSSNNNRTVKKPKLKFGIDAILGLDSSSSDSCDDQDDQKQHNHQPDQLTTSTENNNFATPVTSRKRKGRKPMNGTSPDEFDGQHGGSSNSSKRIRTIFTQEQLDALEVEFMRQQYMVGSERSYLAAQLQLTESQVKIWFQNRRIKWRKGQSPAEQHHQQQKQQDNAASNFNEHSSSFFNESTNASAE